MSKLNKRISFLVMIFILVADMAMGQYSSKDFLTHKIIVNHDNYTVVAYVKPTHKIYVESDRLYYWFSTNLIKSTQGGYSGKLLNGRYQEFFLNKSLKEWGAFSAGLKTGKWKSWDEAGKLKEEYYWDSGKRNGTYSKYDLLGRLAEKGKYRNDLLNGKQTVMLGDSTKVAYFKKGKPVAKPHILPKFIRNIFSKKTTKHTESQIQ
ncbi:toxin-antitoxin system YwqK family antitoxin [Pedobacter panaciterrae]